MSSPVDTASAAITMRPRFLGAPGERVFTQQFVPRGTVRGHIVYLPPFAEEMNRCRAIVATQARAFAAQGFTCTLLDFYGTGDSDGVLEEASLQRWQDDIHTTIDTLQTETEAPLVLWGLRLGALIALDFAATSRHSISGIILWQPVTSPVLFVNQMLRQRIAMLSMRGLPAEKTADIRERLAQGEHVEIAGYRVSGKLVAELEAIDSTRMRDLCSGQIHWIEHVLERGREPGPATRKAIAQLEALDNSIDTYTFTGAQIWQVANREPADELLAVSSGLSL